jgi:PilZ domain
LPVATGFGGRHGDRGQLFNVWRYDLAKALIGAEMMEERRKHPRTEINQPAYVSSAGSVMSCVVCNISAEGAAIEVENPAFVPAQFRLVMVSDKSVHECRVAWIQRNRIGVTFAAAPQQPQRQDKKLQDHDNE